MRTFIQAPEYREVDPMKDFCIVSDIDGTVALFDGRTPYETERVLEDIDHSPVVEMLRVLYRQSPHYDIVFVTGREARPQVVADTNMWLREVMYFLPEENMRLFMRPAGDDRRDDIIKREIMEEDVFPYWNVEYVFEDRNRCVEMYRSLNVPTFQVGPGDF